MCKRAYPDCRIPSFAGRNNISFATALGRLSMEKGGAANRDTLKEARSRRGSKDREKEEEKRKKEDVVKSGTDGTRWN